MAHFTPVRNEQVSVGTTAVTVASPMARKVIYIRNTSTGVQTITLSFGNKTATSGGGGVVLKPGEVIVDANSEGYECWQEQIWGISDIAGGTLSVFER